MTDEEIKLYLEQQQEETEASLWQSTVKFKPYLLEKIFGDGMKLIYFGNLDERPYWWLVRVDSHADDNDWEDFDSEEIYQAIEEECGCHEYDKFAEVDEDGYDKYGVKANTAKETAATLPEKRWLVESTGVAHHYYIKNENGFYISDMEINLGTACNGFDQSEAMEFVVSYLDDGALYFTTESADGEQMYMTLDITDNTIVGNRQLLETAKWSVRRVEHNNTAIEDVKSENGMNGTIYDLQGRKVDTPSKGLYIVDGKKVLVK
jgi:hypothetical protein